MLSKDRHYELTLFTKSRTESFGLLPRLAKITSLGVYPLNRGRNVTKLYIMAPMLKMSAFYVNFFRLSISGPMYPGVPQLRHIWSSSSARQAMPRSVIQTWRLSSLTTSMLFGLMSLWRMFFLCIQSTANMSWLMIFLMLSSFSLSYFSRYWNNVPCFAKGMTMKNIKLTDASSSTAST